MRLDLAYRLLKHVTLGLSCACLLYGEELILPGAEWGALPALLLVALAFAVEGRWVLPAWAANLLAVVAAAGSVGWFALQLQDPDSWVHYMTPTAALVPHLGPLLVALLLVKLFRPRGPGEFWRLQGIGLIQVALGCVLATGAVFGLLLACYLVSGLACLAVAYLHAGRAEAAAAGTAPAGPARVPYRGLLFALPLRWALLVGLPALFLFLITPRGEDSWNPFRSFAQDRSRLVKFPAETGFSERMDLNRTGTLQLDDAVAFTVVATDEHGRPRLDLPAEQRWRGVVLDRYERGVWTSLLKLPKGPFMLHTQDRLPNFGEGQFFLTFSVETGRAGGLFLADPVRIARQGLLLPVVQLEGPTQFPLFYEVAGTLVPIVAPDSACRYRQVVPGGADPDRVFALNMRPDYLHRLTRNAPEGLEEWTRALLRRLARQRRYGLTPDMVSAEGEALEHWETVGRALTEYLARSGDYTYTLELRRRDESLDPTLDFLFNVKQGYCERYSAGLALMLRSLGIPARVVKGFRGAESQGNGAYLVRHKHAHSWVEILVPRRSPTFRSFSWLSLDPTPAGEPPSSSAFSLWRWWDESRLKGMLWWRELIVNFDAGHQADLWESVRHGEWLPGVPAGAGVPVGTGVLLAVLAAAAGLVIWARRRSPARAGAAARAVAAVAFYARLLALLARHAGLKPRPGQTPREFAAAAGPVLRAHPDTAALDDLPGRLAGLFYRVRFGGHVLDDAEQHDIRADLDRLEAALRQVGRDAPLPTRNP